MGSVIPESAGSRSVFFRVLRYFLSPRHALVVHDHRLRKLRQRFDAVGSEHGISGNNGQAAHFRGRDDESVAGVFVNGRQCRGCDAVSREL